MSFWCHRLDQKNQRKYCKDFCPENFYSFLGASLLMILLSKSPGSPKKLPGSPRKLQKFQGRNPYNIFVAILENRCRHELILSLTDLSLDTSGKMMMKA